MASILLQWSSVRLINKFPTPIDQSIQNFRTLIMDSGGSSSSSSQRLTAKKKIKGCSAISTMKCCQAEKCTADLSEAKPYHRRHKVCEVHSKSGDVLVAGVHQRFCQQCSRFHELWEFDETKRSCRRRLAGHNERRRKITAVESQTN